MVIHDQVDGSWGHVVNDKLFFNGKPDPDSENTRSELWVSDGTGDGTYMVKDIYPDEHHGSVQPEGASFGDKYYFMANDGTNGTSLWVSDGTGDGTYMVKDVNPNTMVLWGQNLFGTGDELYFYEDGPSNNGSELWVSDGTEDGTYEYKDIKPGYGNSGVTKMAQSGTNLFFIASDASGYGLHVIGNVTPILP